MKILYVSVLFVGIVALSGCGNTETGGSGDDLKDLEETMINDTAQGEMNTEQQETPAVDTAADVTKSDSAAQVYTLAQVAEHGTPQDCWAIVDGQVADVTSFFGVHPGGDDNLALACGKDATTIFAANAKHDPNGYAKFKTFTIGSLTQ